MAIKKRLNTGLTITALAILGLSACSDVNETEVEQEHASAEPAKSLASQNAAQNNVNSAPEVNTLTPEEKAEGFRLLFDGNTTEGWRAFNRDDFPPNWVIEDGSLHMVGAANMSQEQQEKRADIIFDEQFSDFILKLEWKISENGNSGIFYLGKENEGENTYDFIWKTAPEMQILDNDGHPDANKGKNGNRQAGSLYDLVPAVPQNAAPVGQWNQVEIHVKDRNVKHMQNGEVVVEYTMDTPEWESMIADSKFPGLNPTWAQVPKAGFIGLQDHSDPVWFRNIKIKPL